VLDHAPAKDKVEAPPKQGTDTGHAGTEALALLGKQVNGFVKSVEPASGVLDFHQAPDVFSGSSSASRLGRNDSSSVAGPHVRDGGAPPGPKGAGISSESAITAPGGAAARPQDAHAVARAPEAAIANPAAHAQGAHPADHAQPKDSPATTYTVKPGDSLWKIEKQHLGPGASNADILKGVHDLAKANHIPLHTDSHGRVTAMIRPGEKLNVPAGHPLGHGEHPHHHSSRAHTPRETPQPGRTPVGPEQPQPAPDKPQPAPDKPQPAPDKPPPKPGDTPTPPGDKPQPKPGDTPTPPGDKPQPKPGDTPTAPGDKPLKPEEQPGKDNTDKFNSPEKQQLVADAAEKYKNQPGKLAEFQANMKALEDRSTHDNLSPQEVAKTYKEVDRLMEAKGDQPLKPEQRQQLAEQVMKQAGHPDSIDQGQHATCALNSVEVRTYTRSPSEAAKLVTDVATTGQYTTKDGTTVKIDAQPHDESLNPVTYDSQRTHASEIFQYTAGNIALEQQNRSTNPPGQKRYEYREPVPGSGDKGESLVDYSQNPPKVLEHDPGLNTGNMGKLRDVEQAITGIHETGTVVGADSYVGDKSDGVQRVHSEKDLNDYLAQCKKDGKFPVTVVVDTTSEPFWTDSGSGTAGGSGGGHALNITDYIPGSPPKVTLDNSWGARADHDASNPVTTHDLYMAMEDPAKKAPDMQRDATQARAQGQPDHYKEFDEARLEHATNPVDKNNPAAKQANDAKYEQNLQQAMQRAAQDWSQHPNPTEQARAMKKLNDEIQSLPAEAQKRLQDQERQLNLR
jgi:hypothetical protein